METRVWGVTGTSINNEDATECDFLLTSPRSNEDLCAINGDGKHTKYNTSTENGSNNNDVIMMRVRRRGDKAGPKPGSKEFPVTRARLILYLVLIVHTISSSSSTIDTQYYHSRYSDEYFHRPSNASTKHATSKCIVNKTDPDKKVDDAMQKSLSRFQMNMSYTALAPMFVAVIFFGSITDVVGRRLMIIMPLAVSMVTHAVMIAVIRFNLDLHVCLVNSFIGGATGSSFVLSIGIYSYTADITPHHQKRTFAIAVIGFVESVTGIVGKLIIGYMIDNLGYFYSSLFPFAFKVITVYVAARYLPETLPDQVRGIRPGCFNPAKYLKNIFAFYVSSGSRRQRGLFCLCMLILFYHYVVTLKHGEIFSLYQLDEPFCWDAEQVSYFTSANAGFNAVVTLVALKVLQRFLSDPVIMLVGQATQMGQFILEGFAYNSAMLYLSFVVGMISSCASYIIRSLLSGMASPEKQGALFTNIAVAESVSEMASNALYHSVYQDTMASMRGAVFVIMGGLVGVGLIFTGLFIYLNRKYEAVDDKHGHRIRDSHGASTKL